ncbi:hypothetical protein ACLB2K_009082 [Fragaria x ananassa]
MADVSGGGAAKNTAKRGKPKNNKNRDLDQRKLLGLVTSATSLAYSFLSRNDLLLLPSQTLTLETLLSSASSALSPLSSPPPPPPPPQPQPPPTQECWFRRFLSDTAAGADSRWRHTFHMSEHSFSILLSILSPFLTAAIPSTPPNYALAAAVFRLAHGAGYKAVGRRFGMDSAAACRAFYAVCKSVNDKLGNLFEFRSDMARIVAGFGWISLPNCCGVLGFGRFGIDSAMLGPNAALLVQALVDSEGRFLHVSAGWPSTMKPEAIFRQSKLYLGVEETRELLNGNVLPQYILGESCFPLLPWLLTPYVRSNAEDESFGVSEKAFNSAHSRAMGLVGTAFVRVRVRWQLLSREWKEECREFLQFVVVTGCLLNNFLMKCSEPQPDVNEECLEELPVFEGEMDASGERIRDALATHLSRPHIVTVARAMDWFAWLSKTSLEPSLVYEYGIIFSRNQLQMEDVAFFNHEFLLSMGVSVAKHRLEILKLAKKENQGLHPRAISRLGLALLKTKKCFSKYFTRMSSHETDMSSSSPKYVADQPEKYQEHWRGSLLRKPEVRTRSIALSGPLDMRTHEKLMMVPNPKSLKLSGPLDSKLNERLMYTANKSPRLTSTVSDKLMVAANRSPKAAGPLDGRSYDRLMVSTNRSPKLSGPLDGRVAPYEKENVDFDDHSLWTAMFQDMKPT